MTANPHGYAIFEQKTADLSKKPRRVRARQSSAPTLRVPGPCPHPRLRTWAQTLPSRSSGHCDRTRGSGRSPEHPRNEAQDIPDQTTPPGSIERQIYLYWSTKYIILFTLEEEHPIHSGPRPLRMPGQEGEKSLAWATCLRSPRSFRDHDASSPSAYRLSRSILGTVSA